jgi:hypothetical protein
MSTRSRSTGLVRTTARGHPIDRWEERGDDREFFDALELGPVVELTRPGGEEAYPDVDEVRLYQSGKLERPVLFLVRGGRVVTVRPISDTDIVPSTLKKCSGCGGVHRIVFTNACPHCSPKVREML